VKKNKPGPKPDILKIKGDWKSAAKKMLEAKKPETGWAQIGVVIYGIR